MKDLNEMQDEIKSRLRVLARLQGGWLDGDGKPLSVKGLRWMEPMVTANYPADLACPYIYPTPEGYLRLEWTIGNHDVSLIIYQSLPKDGALHRQWHGLNNATGEETESELNLEDESGWEYMAAQLRMWQGRYPSGKRFSGRETSTGILTVPG